MNGAANRVPQTVTLARHRHYHRH